MGSENCGNISLFYRVIYIFFFTFGMIIYLIFGFLPDNFSPLLLQWPLSVIESHSDKV